MITRIAYPLWGNSLADELRCSIHSFTTKGFPNTKGTITIIVLGDYDKTRYDFLPEVTNGWDIEWYDARKFVEKLPIDTIQPLVTTDLWRKLGLWSLPRHKGQTLILDTDTIALESCEQLHVVEGFAGCENWHAHSYQDPYPLAGPYQSINSGVMVVESDSSVFDGVLHWCETILSEIPICILGRGDECLVNAMRPYNVMPEWKILHRRYNMTTGLLASYEHAKKHKKYNPRTQLIQPIILHATLQMWSEAKHGFMNSIWHNVTRTAIVNSGIPVKEINDKNCLWI